MKRKQQRTDWGVPDWRNASAYPPKVLPIRLWRWEALRRCDDYRRDWSRASRHKGWPRHLRTSNARADAEKYGLVVFVDPRLAHPDEFDLIFAPSWQTRLNESLKWPWFHIPFNVERPLKPQLAAASRWLGHWQNKARAAGRKPKGIRNQGARSTWEMHLRVLDMKAARASNSEIGRTIKDPNRETLEAMVYGRKLVVQAQKWQKKITGYPLTT